MFLECGVSAADCTTQGKINPLSLRQKHCSTSNHKSSISDPEDPDQQVHSNLQHHLGPFTAVSPGWYAVGEVFFLGLGSSEHLERVELKKWKNPE